MTEPQFTIHALDIIRPGAEWILRGWEIIWEETKDENGADIINTPNFEWQDRKQLKPTKQEMTSAIENAKEAWKTLEYQRLRKPEYPPLTDLADALYWQAQGDENKMKKYLAAVDAVKKKYPKE